MGGFSPLTRVVSASNSGGYLSSRTDGAHGVSENPPTECQNLHNAVTGVAQTIRSYLHFSKPDVGPLADSDQYMIHFGDMLATGLQSQAGKIRAAASTLAGSLAGSVSPNVSLQSIGAPGGLPSLSGGGSNNILLQILAAIQQQRGGNSNVSTIQNNSFNLSSVHNVQDLYNLLNQMAGTAFESGLRGAY